MPRLGVVLLLLMIGAGLGAGAYRLIDGSLGMPAVASVSEPATPPFFHEGGKIVVPERSLLRQRLALAPVELKEIPRALVLPAVVEADPARTVKVLPPVAGRIVDLRIQLGERVARGQPLAVIESGDLGQAYADDDKARSMLSLTKQALERQRGLVNAGGGAVKDLEQAESDYALAQAEQERAAARLKEIGASANLRGKSRLLTLTAPITGSVTDLQVAPGTFANDLTASIMTIANLETIWVTANVPEKDIAFVSVAQPVEVTLPAYPGKTFRGKVQFISDILDADTRRAKVRIAFANANGALKPGMFANATFTAPATSQIFVPSSALLMSNDKTSVFVEVAPWTFERREVDPDYQVDSAAGIKSGLSPGDRVVVKGGVLLND